MNTCVCGESKVFYRLKGQNTGCYCVACQKWQKWINKREKAVLVNKGVTIYSEGLAPFGSQKQSEEGNKEKEVQLPCGACGEATHIYAIKGDKIGRYCKKCLKWQRWIKKADARKLYDQGYKMYDYASLRPSSEVVATTEPNVETRDSSTTEYVYGIPEQQDKYEQDEKVDYIDIEYDANPDFNEDEVTSSFDEEMDSDGLTATERATFAEYEKEEGLINAIDCTTCTSGVLDMQGDKNKLYELQMNANEKILMLMNNRMLKIECFADINFCPTCGRRL